MSTTATVQENEDFLELNDLAATLAGLDDFVEEVPEDEDWDEDFNDVFNDTNDKDDDQYIQQRENLELTKDAGKSKLEKKTRKTF